MGIRLVVTDMDNTLYSWVDYVVPAVEAMVEAVVSSTGLPRLKVVQALKAVYTRYESNEYPFALQESAIYAEFPEFGSFDKLVIAPARRAFAEARRRYLRPYKSVLETLAALKEKGVPVVALTDAPRNPAEQRAKHLGIDAFLAGLYTMPAFDFPRGPQGPLVAPDILQREERGEYRASCPVTALPRDHEKPDPRGLSTILKAQGVEPGQVLVVGDSLGKDVAVAQALGCHDCWAEYGTYVSLEYRERLDTISSAAITRRHAASVLEGQEGASSRKPPTHVLSNFGQVLPLVQRLGGRRAPRRRL